MRIPFSCSRTVNLISGRMEGPQPHDQHAAHSNNTKSAYHKLYAPLTLSYALEHHQYQLPCFEAECCQANWRIRGNESNLWTRSPTSVKSVARNCLEQLSCPIETN